MSMSNFLLGQAANPMTAAVADISAGLTAVIAVGVIAITGFSIATYVQSARKKAR